MRSAICARLGRQLGVAFLLEGRVQRAANRVRVNAQLIDARTDAHVWAETYDRDRADVFAIQRRDCQSHRRTVAGEALANEKESHRTRRPRLIWRLSTLYPGQVTSSQGRFQRDLRASPQEAIELLDEAVKRDPSFFDAYCQLAYAHEYLMDLLDCHIPLGLPG